MKDTNYDADNVTVASNFFGAYAVPFPEPVGQPILDPVILYAVAPYAPYAPIPWVSTITPDMIRQIIREELERLLPKRKRR